MAQRRPNQHSTLGRFIPSVESFDLIAGMPLFCGALGALFAFGSPYTYTASALVHVPPGINGEALLAPLGRTAVQANVYGTTAYLSVSSLTSGKAMNSLQGDIDLLSRTPLEEDPKPLRDQVGRNKSEIAEMTLRQERLKKDLDSENVEPFVAATNNILALKTENIRLERQLQRTLVEETINIKETPDVVPLGDGIALGMMAGLAGSGLLLVVRTIRRRWAQ